MNSNYYFYLIFTPLNYKILRYYYYFITTTFILVDNNIVMYKRGIIIIGENNVRLIQET